MFFIQFNNFIFVKIHIIILQKFKNLYFFDNIRIFSTIEFTLEFIRIIFHLLIIRFIRMSYNFRRST